MNQAQKKSEEKTLVYTDVKKIPLVEMFGPTVAGEGAQIGLQTYFLRFGLCDYRCRLCDSMHAVDPIQVKANATWRTNQQIADGFLEYRAKRGISTSWVTFSGGNPCIHDLNDLVALLKEQGIQIHVETQGTFCPDWLEFCDSIVVSPKTPGMGEKLELDKLDAFTYKLRDHTNFTFKIVVFDQIDLECASMVYERYILTGLFRPEQFYLSQGNRFPPSDNTAHASASYLIVQSRELYLSLLPDIMKNPNLCNVKFLPQWHVWLWGNKGGV